jgi:hypothetical protein
MYAHLLVLNNVLKAILNTGKRERREKRIKTKTLFIFLAICSLISASNIYKICVVLYHILVSYRIAFDGYKIFVKLYHTSVSYRTNLYLLYHFTQHCVGATADILSVCFDQSA